MEQKTAGWYRRRNETKFHKMPNQSLTFGRYLLSNDEDDEDEDEEDDDDDEGVSERSFGALAL